jgi:hypothetical protein
MEATFFPPAKLITLQTSFGQAVLQKYLIIDVFGFAFPTEKVLAAFGRLSKNFKKFSLDELELIKTLTVPGALNQFDITCLVDSQYLFDRLLTRSPLTSPIILSAIPHSRLEIRLNNLMDSSTSKDIGSLTKII